MANYLAIHEFEERLHPLQPVPSDEPSVQPASELRKTRGKNNSSQYMRKAREERFAQENESTSRIPEPLEMKVH